MALCGSVNITSYKFDTELARKTAKLMSQVKLGIKEKSVYVKCREMHRNMQTPALLRKLDLALLPCSHGEWLNKRGISTDNAKSLNYDILNLQDMLDLYIVPGDYIIQQYGMKPIEGPVFEDRRDGALLGVCIRNITKDLNYASAEKFTISNFGWFLYGYDSCEPNDEVYLVEGVFDAIMMRKSGYNAVAIAAACPTALQLACMMYKFKNIKICFDNDLFGSAGAYITHEATGFPIYQTELKDPGSYHDGNVKINEIDVDALKVRLNKEIAEYNTSERRPRPMSYN